MMYLYWLLMVPVSLCFTLLALFLAPVLPIFARDEYGLCDNGNAKRTEPRLPAWLSWFMTPDNSLYGDGAWQRMEDGHWEWRVKFAKWPAIERYLGYVGWLLRNSAYGFEWHGPLCAHIMPDALVKFSGDPWIQNRPNGKEGYCLTRIFNPDGSSYWHLYWVKVIGGGYCLNINLGWKLKTYAEDPRRTLTEPLAMFCFSPRITSFAGEAHG